MSRSLEKRSGDNSECRRQEAYTDNSECRYTYFKHIVRRIKHQQKLFRQKLEQYKSASHYNHRKFQSLLVCFHKSVSVLGSVIVPHYRHCTLIESEYRHEYERLNLEIYTEYRNRRCREVNEYLIVEDDHYRADGLHYYGWKSYLIYIGNNSPVNLKASNCKLNQMVTLKGYNCSYNHTAELSEYSCNSSSRNSHFRCTQQSEDKYRV